MLLTTFLKTFGVKLKNNRCELEVKDLPDIEEAKRLWMSGKSAKEIIQAHKDKKSKKKINNR